MRGEQLGIPGETIPFLAHILAILTKCVNVRFEAWLPFVLHMEQRLVGKDFSQILAPGAPGVAKWMWCPKGREGVSEIPFIRAHIENGYDILENSQHNTQTKTQDSKID